MAGTAFVAHGFAKYQAEARELRMRDYSSPEKWMEPKYASRKDMEDVSVPDTLLIFQSWGPSLAIGDTWTASAVCLSAWVGWLGQLEHSFFITLQSLRVPIIDRSVRLLPMRNKC